MCPIEIDPQLTSGTRLYRYVSLEVFLALLETRRTTLTNVNCWDDKWEVILSKIPTVDDQGDRQVSAYSFHQEIFGQCWSLVEESDAMWRIYSPSCTGVRLETSVAKFALIGGLRRGYLGRVRYFDSVDDLLGKSSGSRLSFDDALFKRSAFRHECEVRLLTHGTFLDHFQVRSTHVSLPVDPGKFIEAVTIDPRAGDWYVSAVQQYSSRVGLPAQPAKSVLYESDPQLKLGLVKQWLGVQEES